MTDAEVARDIQDIRKHLKRMRCSMTSVSHLLDKDMPLKDKAVELEKLARDCVYHSEVIEEIAIRWRIALQV